MTDTVTLADQVLTLLDTLTPTVYDAHVPSTPPGAYYVFYDTAPGVYARRLSGDATSVDWTFRIVCVGRDAAEARYVAKQALDLLANRRLNTDAGTSWLVPDRDGAPVLPDQSVPGNIRFSQTLTFSLTTSRS